MKLFYLVTTLFLINTTAVAYDYVDIIFNEYMNFNIGNDTAELGVYENLDEWGVTFTTPHDIYIDSEEIYITDTQNSRILILNKNTNDTKSIETNGLVSLIEKIDNKLIAYGIFVENDYFITIYDHEDFSIAYNGDILDKMGGHKLEGLKFRKYFLQVIDDFIVGESYTGDNILIVDINPERQAYNKVLLGKEAIDYLHENSDIKIENIEDQILIIDKNSNLRTLRMKKFIKYIIQRNIKFKNDVDTLLKDIGRVESTMYFIGSDHDGNMYWSNNVSIFVFTMNGVFTILVPDHPTMCIRFTLDEDGNLYSLWQDDDKLILGKCEKTW